MLVNLKTKNNHLTHLSGPEHGFVYYLTIDNVRVFGVAEKRIKRYMGVENQVTDRNNEATKMMSNKIK